MMQHILFISLLTYTSHSILCSGKSIDELAFKLEAEQMRLEDLKSKEKLQRKRISRSQEELKIAKKQQKSIRKNQQGTIPHSKSAASFTRI